MPTQLTCIPVDPTFNSGVHAACKQRHGRFSEFTDDYCGHIDGDRSVTIVIIHCKCQQILIIERENNFIRLHLF